MKNLRLLRMAVLTLVMSAGFIACSSSDDDENRPESTTKKLVKISCEYDGKTREQHFSFDTDGKLTTFIGGPLYVETIGSGTSSAISRTYGSESNTYSLNWSNGKISITSTDGDNITCGFTDNLVRNSTNRDIVYTYNDDNRLTKVSSHNSSICTYEWDGDKLISCSGSHAANISYSYSGKTCKGFNPVFVIDNKATEYNYWFTACPEYIGLKSNQLPDGFKYKYNPNEEAKITYKFDSDGYVTEYTIQNYIDGVLSTNNYSTWKYKLTWK